MALFKFGGGHAGIKEYLEEGKKQGRELSRDQIDLRIILDGDLEICDRIIQQRDTNAKRYDHLTLSFKERDISPETLKAITADFKAFLMEAYGDGELYFYAEAHMPKTATEQKWNAATKKYETVVRYPHIHFVVPKTNVVTGEYASPFEMLRLTYASKDQTKDFVDAFQETMNEKYGLASPKDNRRTGFVSHADILSRVKEDVFTGRNRKALTAIREAMIEQKIESPEAFRAMLDGMGVVTEGKGGEYLQIKFPGERQNVRLKDFQFSNEFLSKSMEEKFDFYTNRANKQTLEQRATVAADRAALLKQWKDRAREIKYLTPSSPFYQEQYAVATKEQRTGMLDRLEVAHFTRLHALHGYSSGRTLNTSALEADQAAAVDAHLAAPRIEAFSNDRLNATFLRTSAELREAELAGAKIIKEPSAALAALTFSQSHFNEGALERHLLKNTADQEQYDEAMRAVLACPGLVVHRDDERGLLFTSGTIVEIERNLAARASRMALTHHEAVSAAGQQRLVDNKPFNNGQREAFRLLCSDRQLAVVNGAAGTGKSFVLAAMREAYERDGYTVYGAILQGKTAEDLERDSGIKSRTIASMLMGLNSGSFKLNSKSVVVVDEAGMVGSRDLEKLTSYAEAAGARLRLVGDAKQLAAVEYGNAFVEISKRSEVASLTEIMRQKTAWMRAASEKLAVHDLSALREYAEHGHVHFADTTKDAQIALVNAWNDHRAGHPGQTRIVLAHTNAERIALNEMMREQLQKEGHLKDEVDVQCARGVIKMAVGEHVMFTAGSKALGVKNGTTGTITKICNGEIAVKLDSGKSATFRADGEGTTNGNEVDVAYAVTVHKSQGMTLDKAFVLGNPIMSRENLYVGMTRHRHDVELFVSEEDFKNVDELVKTLDRANEKAFTASKTWTDTKRPEDSVIGQMIADLNSEKVIQRAATTASHKEVVANLEIRRVLNHASKVYGLDPKAFEVVMDRAGKQMIQSTTGRLDAANFLTKVLHLDYKNEAAPILKQCYAEQLAGVYSEPRRAPRQTIDQSMQREFANYLKDRAKKYKVVKESIDQTKRTEIAAIDKSKTPEADKKQARAALDAAVKAEKAALTAEHNKPTDALYKDFLAERSIGSAKHLQELARVSATPADIERLASVRAKAGITVPDLSHLSATQIAIGVANVIDRNQAGPPPAHILARGAGDIGRPADHFLRAATHFPGPAPARSGGVHELSHGCLDETGPERPVLLPTNVHGGVGVRASGQDQDVRSSRASAPGGGSRVAVAPAVAPSNDLPRQAQRAAAEQAAKGFEEANAAEAIDIADAAKTADEQAPDHQAHLTNADQGLIARTEQTIATLAGGQAAAGHQEKHVIEVLAKQQSTLELLCAQAAKKSNEPHRRALAAERDRLRELCLISLTPEQQRQLATRVEREKGSSLGR